MFRRSGYGLRSNQSEANTRNMMSLGILGRV